jgi:hypothetical protein
MAEKILVPFEGSWMKTALSAVVFVGLLFLGALDLSAQTYPYYYWDGTQYQQYWPQEYDPYYELHVMHYQLYLPQYQYQPYPIYQPVYQPCCFIGGAVISRPSAPVMPLPQARLPVTRRR